MTNWIPDRNDLSPPLHASLAAAIARAIETGALKEGDRLPPHRTLAASLGLSVHTVSKAYDNLRRQNMIDGKVGRGSFVLNPVRADDQPFDVEPHRRGSFDLSISRQLCSALHVNRMQAMLQDLPKDLNPRTFLACRPNAGMAEHREAGRLWLAHCGLKADSEAILVTNGISHGISSALSALARQGDTVLTDMVTHNLTVSASAYLGLNLAGVATDAHGIMPDALEAACREKKARVLCLLPNGANPKAYVMPEERRRALAQIARKHDLHIIENDAFAPIVESVAPPVSAFAPERSVYLATLSKSTVPGLRIGYAAAPPQIYPTLLGRLMVFGWMAPPLLAEIASRWVRDGTALELAQWQRMQMRSRHDILHRALKGHDLSGSATSLHAWLRLPEGWSSDHFVRYASQFNVWVAPERPFLTPNAASENAVRLSKGSTQEDEGFAQAVQNIARFLEHPHDPLPQALY